MSVYLCRRIKPFSFPKHDGSSRPVINLKNLYAILRYDHFKMECTQLLRDLLKLTQRVVRKDRFKRCAFRDTYSGK